MNSQSTIIPTVSPKIQYDIVSESWIHIYHFLYAILNLLLIAFADVIYSFRLEAAKSYIPGAGNGVFLTFLGARELKPSVRKRGEAIIDDRPWGQVNELFDSRNVYHKHGWGMTVTITGKHLKAPYNSELAYPPLVATIPPEILPNGNVLQPKPMVVHFSDPDLPYSEMELQSLRDPKNRIGHYGLYSDADYVDAPRRTFSSLHANCGMIDIGRYGAYKKEGEWL